MPEYLSQQEVDKRLFDRNLILLDKYKGCNTKHNIKCYCGNIFFSKLSHIFHNKVRSCGCYHKKRVTECRLKDLTGQRFGRLLVFSRCKNRNDRGQAYCQNMRNGVLTSYKALELHNMIGQGEHNYFINIGETKPINVDIAIPDQKIVIEYDEWYWHQNRLDQDKKKTTQLIQNGWQVIRVLAHNNLPIQSQVDKALINIDKINPYIIQLDGWGKD